MTTASKTNLVPEATLFVGRDDELAALRDLMDANSRVITLVGAPGIGKTSLSRRFGTDQLSLFGRAGDGGVWFCDLTECRTLDQITAQVADVLDLSGAGDTDALARIGHALASRGRTLIILDNLEQVIEPACQAIVAWLSRAPGVVFVVTSRERTRLTEEAILELEPLSGSHGAALFIERSRRLRPTYAPDETERAAIDEIVTRLEGIPLAIELAAARMGVLTASGLLQRLERRFDLLGNVRRGARDRQATLWGAIEWSWELLDPHEQKALSDCSVFRGGFTLDAAEHVVELGDAPGTPWTIDVVQGLRDKSILRTYQPPDLPGELRFGFFESIREFATSKCEDCEPLRGRHAAWYVDNGLQWAGAVHTHDGPNARRRLALESENLIGIVEHALIDRETELARRALLALDPILATRGPYATYLDMLNRSLEDPTTGDGTLAARLLTCRGNLRRKLGHPNEALVDLEQAIEAARRVADRAAEAAAIADLGIVHHEQGRLDGAREHHERALSLFRDAGDRRGEGRALGSLAILHHEQGDTNSAQIHYEQALTILRRHGDRHSEAIFLSNLGDLHHEQRRPGEARAHYEASLAILRAVGDRRIEGVVLGNLGAILQEGGDYGDAHNRRSESLAVLQQVGDERLVGILRGYLGGLHLERPPGDMTAAVTDLQEALAAVRAAGDRRFEGLFLAYLGVAEATRDRLAAATAAFDAAESVLADHEDRWLSLAARVHGAHLDLLRLRTARAADKEAGGAHLEAITERLAAAESEPTPMNESDEVRFAVRLLRQAVMTHAPDALAQRPATADRVLTIAPEARGFIPPEGEPVDLGRRRSLRLILRKLATHRLTAAGQALSLDDLLEAGWPGERVLPEAAANRVYVAVATMRKLGLRDVLLSRDDGYLLTTDIDVVYGDNA